MNDHAHTTRDRGQVLVMVLAFITFGGLVGTALLSFTATSLRVSAALQHERDQRYVASAAVDTHIEYLRNNAALATAPGTCPSSTLELNGVVADVACSNTGSTTIGRDLIIEATVDTETVLTAEVFIDAGADPDVFVNQWTLGIAAAP